MVGETLPIEYIIKDYALGARTFRLKKVKNLDQLLEHISDELFAQDERLPYWAELWPSAIGLSHFLLTHSSLITGQHVLELGVGLGLTSLVLQTLHPSILLLTDYEESALRLTSENFRLNGFAAPRVQLLDWRRPALSQPFERIVASDILYEQRFFLPLIQLFKKFLTPDGRIIIAEPNRSIAKNFFKMLMDFGFSYDFTIIPVVQDGKTIQVHNYLIRKIK